MSTHQIDESTAGYRLDVYIAELLDKLPRSKAQELIQFGDVLVNNQKKNKSYKLKVGDKVTVSITEQKSNGRAIATSSLDLLFENEQTIVINKPAGILTHARSESDTELSVSQVLAEKIDDKTEPKRAGIVHRLDKDTSGVLLVARTTEARLFYQKQFAERSVVKVYHAIVHGHLKHSSYTLKWPVGRNPKQQNTWRVDPQGKPAETEVQLVQEYAKTCKVELTPKTGRTHQLRVHMQKLGHPILGDAFYGSDDYSHLYLHASKLEFTEFATKKRMSLEAPLPHYMLNYR